MAVNSGLVPARRVGLFRALLVAHGQMMVNRTRKGLGRRGLAGVVVVLVFLFAGSVPLVLSFAYLGLIFGRAAGEALVPPLMGSVLTGATLGFGVVGGLLGGARQLTWDAYRSFPVPFRTLFFAETFASLGDLIVLAFLGVTAAMATTFVWERPTSAVLILLVFGQALLWVVFIQHLVGSLAVTAVRRLRRALVVVLVAGWASVSLVAGAARDLRDGLDGDAFEHLRAFWHAGRPVITGLPTVLGVRGITAALEGRYVESLYLQLPMLAVTLMLGAVSYALLRRESQPRVVEAGSEGRVGWRFRGRLSPRWALASLHLRHVLGSLQGRFGLVVPVITIVLVRGPLLSAGIGAKLTLPGSIIYLGLAATQFHFNQFGLDGQGVKTLFLLPVDMRDVLLGKSYALLAYVALQNAFLFALLVLVLHLHPGQLVSGALLAGSLAVAELLEGHWLSALFPRPLAMHRMNAVGLSGANLLPVGMGILNAALFGGVYALASAGTEVARTIILVAVLLGTVAAYRALLPRSSAFVERRRERLVEILG